MTETINKKTNKTNMEPQNTAEQANKPKKITEEDVLFLICISLSGIFGISTIIACLVYHSNWGILFAFLGILFGMPDPPNRHSSDPQDAEGSC